MMVVWVRTIRDARSALRGKRARRSSNFPLPFHIDHGTAFRSESEIPDLALLLLASPERKSVCVPLPSSCPACSRLRLYRGFSGGSLRVKTIAFPGRPQPDGTSGVSSLHVLLSTAHQAQGGTDPQAAYRPSRILIFSRRGRRFSGDDHQSLVMGHFWTSRDGVFHKSSSSGACSHTSAV